MVGLLVVVEENDDNDFDDDNDVDVDDGFVTMVAALVVGLEVRRGRDALLSSAALADMELEEVVMVAEDVAIGTEQ